MTDPAIHLRGAALSFGDRTLWSGLDLEVRQGEFLAVLGPNGSGKTSLARTLLGTQPLTAGSIEVCGRPPRRGDPTLGYVPQQRAFDRDVPLRGRDLVRLGLDGHRFGLPLPWSSRNAAANAQVDEVLEAVGATGYADAPLGLLSGGEQQRLRIAQALLGNPRVLLCDEPLLSLDLQHQQADAKLIDARRREADTAVVFITHELNPILELVDRVLYLVNGAFRIGTPTEVMTSATLSELYGTPVDVLQVRGRMIVVGAPDQDHDALCDPGHAHGAHESHPAEAH
jgi:zinc/manganese transport system ATP-binding protein